jgi:hypothetical protein
MYLELQCRLIIIFYHFLSNQSKQLNTSPIKEKSNIDSIVDDAIGDLSSEDECSIESIPGR